MNDTTRIPSTNPIIVAFNKDWAENATDQHENDLALCADRWLISAVEEPAADDYYSQAERDEAARVLRQVISEQGAMGDADTIKIARTIETGMLVVDQDGDTLRYRGPGEDPRISRVIYDGRNDGYPSIECDPRSVAPVDAVPKLADLNRKDPRITVANDKAGRPNSWSGSWRAQIPGDLNPRWSRTKGEATAQAARRLAIADWWSGEVPAEQPVEDLTD